MRPRLDASSSSHTVIRYTSQEKGKEGHDVSLRIGAQAEKVKKGTETEMERTTASMVYHVISGQGRTRVGAEVIEWEKGDTFCVPSWAGCSHIVSSAARNVYARARSTDHQVDEDSYLFRYDDKPMLHGLGVYRNESDGFLTAP
jgi:gentisate 1,2-dioxygenase